MQTEIAPMEIHARAIMERPSPCSNGCGLQKSPAVGYCALFPTPACARLDRNKPAGLRPMLWPRVYADLRTAGVRGEDAVKYRLRGDDQMNDEEPPRFRAVARRAAELARASGASLREGDLHSDKAIKHWARHYCDGSTRAVAVPTRAK